MNDQAFNKFSSLVGISSWTPYLQHLILLDEEQLHMEAFFYTILSPASMYFLDATLHSEVSANYLNTKLHSLHSQPNKHVHIVRLLMKMTYGLMRP